MFDGDITVGLCTLSLRLGYIPIAVLALCNAAEGTDEVRLVKLMAATS